MLTPLPRSGSRPQRIGGGRMTEAEEDEQMMSRFIKEAEAEKARQLVVQPTCAYTG